MGGFTDTGTSELQHDSPPQAGLTRSSTPGSGPSVQELTALTSSSSVLATTTVRDLASASTSTAPLATPLPLDDNFNPHLCALCRNTPFSPLPLACGHRVCSHHLDGSHAHCSTEGVTNSVSLHLGDGSHTFLSGSSSLEMPLIGTSLLNFSLFCNVDFNLDRSLNTVIFPSSTGSTGKFHRYPRLWWVPFGFH